MYVYNVLLTLKLFYCTICCPYDERSYYVYAFMDEWRSNFCQSNVNLSISCLYCHNDLFFLERVGYLQIIIIALLYPKYNNLIRKKKILWYNENNHHFFFFFYIGRKITLLGIIIIGNPCVSPSSPCLRKLLYSKHGLRRWGILPLSTVYVYHFISMLIVMLSR